MNNILNSIVGTMIPFVGTSLGSGFVFFLKNKINEKIQKILIGIAAGVMIAASIWSLILPAVEMTEKQNVIPWVPVVLGFIAGITFLLLTSYMADEIEKKRKGKKMNMLLFSVTLHNIPEGMAVGVCFAGFLNGNMGIELLEAMLLATGIAIQNIPEGAIISMPLKIDGMSKKKSFYYGILSGIVEPISALLTIVLLNIIVPLLPYLLSFAAGAMIYVVIEELIPEVHSKDKSKLGVIGVTIGFVLMMILDLSF